MPQVDSATYLSEYNYGHDKSGNKLAANAIEDLEKYWGTGLLPLRL